MLSIRSALLSVLLLAISVGAQEVVPTAKQLQDATTAGTAAMQLQAEYSLGHAEELAAAIRGNNLTNATQWYRWSRDHYEQVEVLAYGFSDIDSDIDARPVAFPEGEASSDPESAEPGTMFMGFHRIEALLFRDNNTASALPYAEKLVNSSNMLMEAIASPENFDAAGHFKGMVSLATEVAGKKISSEEETFSDISIAIFLGNLEGIHAVYAPFAPLIRQASESEAFKLDALFSACYNALSPYYEWVSAAEEWPEAVPYSYITPQQRAEIQTSFYNLAYGLFEASYYLGLTLEAAEEEEETCTPTVNAAAIDITSPQMQTGLQYFGSLMNAQQTQATQLSAAIRVKDLDGAQGAYQRMRPMYEQIEVLAAAFPDIDTDIDAREYAFPHGERDAVFRGNHRLEAMLFRDENLGPQTYKYAQQLENAFQTLSAVFETPAPENFTLQNHWNGIIGLATEIVAKKISSEEEKYSDLSLLIFYNNYKGIYSQAAPFYTPEAAPLKEELENAITATVDCLNVETTDQILDVSTANGANATLEGIQSADYGRYSQVTMAQKACISSNGYRVRSALVAAARQLNLLDDCSDYYEEMMALTPTDSVANAGK